MSVSLGQPFHLRDPCAPSFRMGYCLNVGGYSPQCEELPSSDRDPASMNTHGNKELWQWWWCWIRAKKGCLWVDMGKEELGMGCGKISWRHLFWKLRAKLRNRIATTRPSQGFKYDAGSYALNFDDGCWQELHEHCLAGKYHGNAVHPVILDTCKPAS